MRTIAITRDEAELVTDLLMLVDDESAHDLDVRLRAVFGMYRSRDAELEANRETLSAFRAKWVKKLQG